METGSHGWNDAMYARHPTPYTGLAGLVEKLRVWKVQSVAQIRPDDRVLVGAPVPGEDPAQRLQHEHHAHAARIDDAGRRKRR